MGGGCIGEKTRTFRCFSRVASTMSLKGGLNEATSPLIWPTVQFRLRVECRAVSPEM